MMRRVIILSCFFMASIAFANSGVYRYQDKDGNVSYSDQPTPGAKKIKLKPIQTYQPVQVDVIKVKPKEAAEKKHDYSSLRIVNPTFDQTFRGNSEGNIVVDVNLPKLKPHHYLVVTMDGREVTKMEKEGSDIRIENIDRGMHVLEAQIQDKRGNVIMKSKEVPFHMKLPTIRRRPLKRIRPAAQLPLGHVTAPRLSVVLPNNQPLATLSKGNPLIKIESQPKQRELTELTSANP